MALDNLTSRRCQNKRGFFVIRQCRRPSIIKCPITHQYVCDECSVVYNGTRISRDGYIHEMKKSGKTENFSQRDDFDDYYDNDPVIWYHFMRNDFYHSNNYEPFNSFDSQGFGNSGSFGDGEFGGAGASGGWDDDSGMGSLYDS